MQRVTMLGEEDGPGAMRAEPTSVVRDSRGWYYVVAPDVDSGAVRIYDERGEYFGRLGDETGAKDQYRTASLLHVSAGDTLHVFDPPNARVTVVSPAQRVVRTWEGLPATEDVALRSDGMYVINDRSPSNSDGAFRLFSNLGEAMSSFGSLDVDRSPGQETMRSARALGLGTDGRLWSAHRHFRIVIERWSSDGTREQEQAHQAPWFPPHDSLWEPTFNLPPPASVTGVWEGDDGLLWIVGQAPDPQWTEGFGEPEWLEGQFVFPVEDRERLFDGVIDIVDPQNGESVTWQRLKNVGPFLTVIEPGMIGARRQEEDGMWLVEVLRLSLRGASSGAQKVRRER
jgi:hypothetical protein